MRYMKGNYIIAILFAAGIFLWSVGRVSGREVAEIYRAPDLLLTQGQASYDLCNEIEYDETKYHLSVQDQGDFDIDKPGSYQVEYLLTPAAPEADEGEGPDGTAAPKADKEKSLQWSRTVQVETAAPEDGQTPKGAEKTGTAATGMENAAAEAEHGAAAENAAAEVKHAAAAENAAAEVKHGAAAENAAAAENVAAKAEHAAAENAAVENATAKAEHAAAAENTEAKVETSEGETAKAKAGTAKVEADHIASATSSPTAAAGSTLEAGSALAAENTTAPKSPTMPDMSPKGAAAGTAAAPASTVTLFSASTKSGTSYRERNFPNFLNLPKFTLFSNSTINEKLPRGTTSEAAQAVYSPAMSIPAVPALATPSDAIVPAMKASSPEQSAQSSSGQSARPAPEPGTVAFSRTVIVVAAVSYKDIRFDVNTAPSLLTGMAYDKGHYRVSVADDGGFDGGRIDEYRVVYSLDNTDNGEHVADLERYVWVTAPGMDFDAPELILRLDQEDYDLQAGISYDRESYALATAESYDLDTMEQTAVDTQRAGKWRVMFRLTEGTEGAAIQVLPEAQPGGNGGAASPKAQPQKELAIFGRNVKVEADQVVVIDAPPLILAKGKTAGINLLDGVTARDQDGNPVKPWVADRFQLDQAAGGGASSPRSRSGYSPSLAVATPATPSQGTVADGGSSARNLIQAPESTDLPPGLPPGQYRIALAAIHPATGERFMAERAVEVREVVTGSVKLDYPAGSGLPVTGFPDLASAIAAIGADNLVSGRPGEYRLTLLKDYSLTGADEDALGKLGFMAPNVTVAVTGKDASSPDSPVRTLSLMTALKFPKGSAGVSGPAFLIEDIRISGGQWIIANGSKLTLGDGIANSPNLNVAGGAGELATVWADQTFTGNTWLDVRSGHYNTIAGGNLHTCLYKPTAKAYKTFSTVIGETTCA